MAEELKIVPAPCSSCVRETAHTVLHEKGHHTEEDTIETFALLECRGCGEISMGRQIRWTSDGSIKNHYYPSPVSRKKPAWLWRLSFGFVGSKGEHSLGELLNEIYQAMDGGQHRLAAMGIRALLEQIMIAKVSDLRTFNEKLDAFQKAGYISFLQRDAMRATLDVGDAAMHRAFKPTEQELSTALDIVETVFDVIYGQEGAAEKLTTRVPPRAPRTE